MWIRINLMRIRIQVSNISKWTLSYLLEVDKKMFTVMADDPVYFKWMDPDPTPALESKIWSYLNPY